jgi:hypothetical protein
MSVGSLLKPLLLSGVLLGCSLTAQSQTSSSGASTAGSDLAAMRAEVDRLKSLVPGQSVAMTQVAYNFNNLWFAVHARNWPLAQFYFGDTRGRLRWALRITPKRKISTGEIELQPILDGLENNQLAKLGETIANKDIPQFEAAYRATLEGCHGCHAASEKPYLELQVPTAPAEPMIRFAPH